VVTDIVTDKATVEDKKDPETSNIFALYKLFATDAEREDMAARFRAGGLGYGVAKTALLEKIDAYFAPARERRKELAANPEYVECVLRDGAKRARTEAQKTMELVRQATGLR
jgi:tryptophanyl-tRNA synthetase